MANAIESIATDFDFHRNNMNTGDGFKRFRSHEWRQGGRVSLWRYASPNRNYDGWHLTADAQARASLMALIDAMLVDGPGATRSICITPPTKAMLDVPNCPIRKVIVPENLRLSIVTDPNEWVFPEVSEHARLSVGVDWLPLLHDGLRDIGQGLGDYSIGRTDRGSLPLWFWW
jgi:hypothetical protein